MPGTLTLCALAVLLTGRVISLMNMKQNTLFCADSTLVHRPTHGPKQGPTDSPTDLRADSLACHTSSTHLFDRQHSGRLQGKHIEQQPCNFLWCVPNTPGHPVMSQQAPSLSRTRTSLFCSPLTVSLVVRQLTSLALFKRSKMATTTMGLLQTFWRMVDFNCCNQHIQGQTSSCLLVPGFHPCCCHFSALKHVPSYHETTPHQLADPAMGKQNIQMLLDGHSFDCSKANLDNTMKVLVDGTPTGECNPNEGHMEHFTKHFV